MNRYLHAFRLFACGLLLSAPAAAHSSVRRTLDSTEIQALRIHSDPSLGSLRAGAVLRDDGLQVDERQALRSAESASPDLGEMRAGDDAVTILAVVLAVVLLILIL